MSSLRSTRRGRARLKSIVAAVVVALALGLAAVFLRPPSGKGAASSTVSHPPQEKNGSAAASRHPGGAARVAPAEGKGGAASRPVPKDPRLLTALDRESRNRAAVLASIPAVRDPEDLPIVAAWVEDPAEDDTLRNEATLLLRRSRHPDLHQALLRVVGDPREGPLFASFAVQHLGRIVKENEAPTPEAREAIIEALRKALEDQRPAIRREALLALAWVRDPSSIEKAKAWLEDGSKSDVQDVAIRGVSREILDLPECIPLVRRYLGDSDVVTRLQALQALSAWGDEGSRTGFAEAAASVEERLRKAGRAALDRLDRGGAPGPGSGG